MKKRHFMGLVILLLAISVPSSTPAASASVGAQKPVKLGSVLALTGALGKYGEDNKRGIEMAVEKINASGGINGHKLTIVFEDSGSDRVQTQSLVKKLAGDSDVLAIIGSGDSSSFVAISGLLPDLKLVALSPGATVLWRGEFNKWTFRDTLIPAQAIPDVLKRIKEKLGTKSIGVLYDTANDYAAGEAQFVQSSAKNLGLDIYGVERFKQGDTDFSTQLTNFKGKQPDLLYLAGTTNELALIIQQARARGIKSVFLGAAGLNDPSIYKLSGGAADGSLTIFPFNPEDPRPIVKGFVTLYQSKYKTVPPAYAAYGYDAVLLMADAIKRAKSLTRDGLQAALGQTKGLEGVNGKYTYNGKGDNVTPAFFLYKLTKNGFQPFTK